MAKKLHLEDTLRLTLQAGDHKLAHDLLILAGYTKRAAAREVSRLASN